jgi:uncharacterized membrane protein YeaQ/YmgE (transglycosylase-associated protein family)
MGWLSWIVFGLLAGLVARLVVPGRQRLGLIATLAVGIVGALIGGLIGQYALGHKVHYGWDLKPFLLAVVGAIVLLLLLQAAGGGRRRRGIL